MGLLLYKGKYKEENILIDFLGAQGKGQGKGQRMPRARHRGYNRGIHIKA